MRTADGSYRWRRSRSNPRQDEDGRIIAWYGLAEDIYARKEFELALISYIDARMRLVELNDALAEINGLPQQQLTARRLPEIALSPVRQKLTTLHAEVLQGKKPITGIEFGVESNSQAGGRRDWLASLYP